MKSKHGCPVCGARDWKYDVVSMEGVAYCGDCYDDVTQKARELKYGQIYYGILTFSVSEWEKAIRAVRREKQGEGTKPFSAVM